MENTYFAFCDSFFFQQIVDNTFKKLIRIGISIPKSFRLLGIIKYTIV